VRDAVSAGGVVWRQGDGGVEVVLCGRKAEGIWVLPKGTPDTGESLEATALREVAEETGLQVRAIRPLTTIDYWFASGGVRFHKRVHHWLMEATGGDTAMHDHEFDVVEWVGIEEAQARLTYDNERRVVAEAARVLAEAAV
jgi:8-oxo-dGTP pyrophosphatase MutT (NUDIX family)